MIADRKSSVTYWALSKYAKLFEPKVSKRALTILTYHRVLDKPDPLCQSEPDTNDFRQQMHVLANYFNVLRLDDGLRLLNSNTLPPQAVCITFDDGYKDNYENALPILEEIGIKATFFIATDYLDGGIMWNDAIRESIRSSASDVLDLSSIKIGKHPAEDYEQKSRLIGKIIRAWKYLPQDQRSENVEKLVGILQVPLPNNLMMDSTEVRNLHAQGMEIGAHTMSHPILAMQELKRSSEEIVRGKELLEKLIDAPVTSFAYPNGKWSKDFTIEHVKFVEKAGYSCAVSTDVGLSRHGDNVYRLPRITPWEQRPLWFYFRLVTNSL